MQIASTSSSHATGSPLAAAVVAHAHRADFERLGAIDIAVTPSGEIETTFANVHDANIVRMIVTESFEPLVSGRPVTVPLRALPESHLGSIGLDDAIAAIRTLDGVSRVATFDAASTMFVGARDAKAATHLTSFLASRILGLDVVVAVDSGLRISTVS